MKPTRFLDRHRGAAWLAAALLGGWPPAAGEDPKDGSSLEKFLEQSQPGEAKPPAPPADLWSRQAGAATIRLIDISLDALFAAGTSTEPDEEIELLQGGGHDPHQRGFTVQNVELSLQGAVDPYLFGEAHLIYFIDTEGESEFELEEAFLTTQSLPWGFQIEAGHFFTEFGRLNPAHPHAWHWLDQPVINTRLFGPDGMRAPGFRIAWLAPLPWFSEAHAGMQNSNGETMASFRANDEFFEERPIGVRPFVERDVRSLEDFAYLLRWDNAVDLGDEITAKLGVSGLWGPNATGPDGQTFIYGADLVVKWRPAANERGWPFVIFESEVMARDYFADDFFDAGDPLDPADDVDLSSDVLHDWGFYAQALWGFRRPWAAGLRYEFAGGAGDSLGGRGEDPFRGDRHRLSPLLAWYPTEFTRLRLQYNFDHASHLRQREAHSFWLGVEILYGKHPAHAF